MYKRIKRKKLGRTKSHRESLIRNMLRSLFDNTYIVTTTTKAKALKQEASSLISKGKNSKDKLILRRRIESILGSEELYHKFEEYVKKDNAGVSMVRVGFRDGDKSELSRVYLLGIEKKKRVVSAKDKDEKESKGKVEEVESKKQDIKIDVDKKVDKTASVKRVGRARSRSGI